MSWLQVYTLRLRCYEHIATSGRVVYVIQLRFGQQHDSRVTDLAKRSYSEFRALWKGLLYATSGRLDDDDHWRSTRRLSRRESWNSVSKLLAGAFRSGGEREGNVSKRRRCRCTETSCPFQRLHHLLKDFPFPGKQLLQHKDAQALQKRLVELEKFLTQLQQFFCGYPRSFLETAASTQRCEVLQLVSDFTGMDIRSPSLSFGTSNPFAGNSESERPRYFSYCVTPVSPTPTLLTDVTDSLADSQLSEEHSSDNQNDPQDPPSPERLSYRSIRSSTVLSTSSSMSLPQLHVKSADVKMYQASLDEVRDNILQQVGPHVQDAIERNQLTPDAQWELALFHAAERGLYADVVTIIRRGTNVNNKVWGEATPLHAASGAGHVHIVEFLLAHGAQMDHQGPVGMTPLMHAVNNNQLETAKLLLRFGADVNLCNLRHVSPVHLAVVRNSMPMLLLLLDHGATVDVPNTVNGRTPLQIAAKAGYKEMCEILVRFGARGSQCSPSGKAAPTQSGSWGVQSLCNEYRRTSSLLDIIEEDDTHERSSADTAHSDGRAFSTALDYVDEDKGGRGGYHAKTDDVAMVAQEGRMYAVL